MAFEDEMLEHFGSNVCVVCGKTSEVLAFATFEGEVYCISCMRALQTKRANKDLNDIDFVLRSVEPPDFDIHASGV